MAEPIGAPAPVAPWPPTFATGAVQRARELFELSGDLMIVGPLGSGRSSLARAVGGDAVFHSWARGGLRATTDDATYVQLNQLVPQVRAAVSAPLDEVVGRATDLLSRGAGPPVFALHDADQSDAGTLGVLSVLARARLIRLISILQSGAAESYPLADHAARLDLPQLDDHLVMRLMEARYGVRVHPTAARIVLARSQGVYPVMRVVADVAVQDGNLVVADQVLVPDPSAPIDPINSNLPDPEYLERFGAGHPAHDLIDVGALLMSLDRDEAAALWGEEAVALAVHDGAVTPDGPVLRMTSIAEAAVLVRRMSTERGRELFDAYAPQLHHSMRLRLSAPRAVIWHRSIDEPIDPGLVVCAATAANRQGRYSLVIEMVSRVGGEERTPRMVVELAHALSESGAVEELGQLAAATDLATVEDDQLFTLVRIFSRAPTTDVDDLLRPVRAAAKADGEVSRLATLDLLDRLAQVTQSCDPEVEVAVRRLVAAGHLTPTNHAMAVATLATFQRNASRTARAVELAEDAVARLRSIDPSPSATNEEAALEILIRAHISNGDLDAAREVLHEYSSPGALFGNVGRIGTALWCQLAFFSGDVDSALAQARLFLARLSVHDPHQLRGWMEAILAQLLLQAGATDEAAAVLSRSTARPRLARRQQDLERRIAQACAHDSLGDPITAVDLLLDVVAEAREHGMLLHQVDAAVLCVQIEGPVHLRLLDAAVASVDDDFGTSTFWRDFARAAGSDQTEALRSLAVELDGRGHRMYAAEVAQFALDRATSGGLMAPDDAAVLENLADPMSHRSITRTS